MAGKFPSRGEYSLPDKLIDEHEWISDALIDQGKDCLLIYPQKEDPCPNCIKDVDTGLSTGIYKVGGPIEFTDYTICPYCNSEGRLYKAEEENIKCRVYYNSKFFMANEEYRKKYNINVDDDVVQIVTYMTNMSKLERAQFLIVDSHIRSSKEYKCQKLSPPLPHGFRHNRYIIQLWKRTG